MADDYIKKEGTIIHEYSAGRYQVDFGNDIDVNCQLSGSMDHHNIDVTVGDKVLVEFHKTDLENGRIIERIS